MHTIISNNMDKINDLCVTHHVKTLFAFGSVCTDNFNDASDIDFLISFYKIDFGDYADNYFDLVEKFEELFHRHVDLITENSLSNPYLITSVNKTRVLVYARDDKKVFV